MPTRRNRDRTTQALLAMFSRGDRVLLDRVNYEKIRGMRATVQSVIKSRGIVRVKVDGRHESYDAYPENLEKIISI
jgi:hypothetical protein